MTTGADALLRRFGLVVSAACVITLVATLGIVAWPRVTHALGITPKPPTMPYLPGGHIDAPADWYASRPRTLIVFARASCGACRKAQPYFQQLVEFVAGRAAVVVAGGADARDQDAEFARLIGINDTGFKLVPAGLRVRATPTLVLVDRQGRILAAWEGVGPPEKQNAIAKMIDEILHGSAVPTVPRVPGFVEVR